MTPSMLVALAAKAGLPRFIKDALGNFRGLFMGGKSVALPYVLVQAAVPVVLVPNGIVAANGAITLGTPLPVVYAGAWVRLPAGAVVGGAAGLYWTTFSSTTVGSVKNLFVDPAQPFLPYVPSVVLTAAVGSGAAYTQTTGADVTLWNVAVPGGAIGPNGSLRYNLEFSYNTAVGSKTFAIKIGGVNIQNSQRSTTGGHDSVTSRMRNRGAENRNSVYASAEASTSSAITVQQQAIDTTAIQNFVVSVNVDTATNYGIIEALTIEVLPS